jgi:hypothetical protein
VVYSEGAGPDAPGMGAVGLPDTLNIAYLYPHCLLVQAQNEWQMVYRSPVRTVPRAEGRPCPERA